MDFARKQLEKYGWTDGKGLGRHENGISEPLKPKLKRSVAGIGHDAASDFTEHWWTALYDKATGNVQVEEKNGKTKKIKTKDKQFKITNSTWKLNKTSKGDEEEYSEYFVKKAVLANGGSKLEKIRDSESDEEEIVKKDVMIMTDEELFAACEGRTAHKGARHGLKALGKLARIERQEQMLLKEPRYKGYSHAKKLKDKLSINSSHVIENISLNDESELVEVKKKKKKKLCSNEAKVNVAEDASDVLNDTQMEAVGTEVPTNDDGKIKKKSKKRYQEINSFVAEKKKKSRDTTVNEVLDTEMMDLEVMDSSKKTKRKKIKD